MAIELIEAKLIKRYKRFLADVRLENGQEITVHCPNTGAMTGCAEPGMRVWLSTSENPKRKYPHTWELGELNNGDKICIHSASANKVVEQALARGGISELKHYSYIQREVKIDDGSRIDFCLTEPVQEQGVPGVCYVEVKSVTLAMGGGLGAFPDAVSKRALKHIESLLQLKAEGHRVVLFFAVLHTGIQRVQAAVHIDPAYAEGLRQAMQEGLEVICYGAEIQPREAEAVRLTGPLAFLDWAD